MLKGTLFFPALVKLLLARQDSADLLSQRKFSEWYGSLALQHLKVIYCSTLFSDVEECCHLYASNPRCRQYLPEILYLGWSAARRDGKLSHARTWKTLFMEQFANLDLAADMILNESLDFVAQGDYPRAAENLRSLILKYPSWSNRKRAENLLARLDDAGHSELQLRTIGGAENDGTSGGKTPG